MDRHHHQGHEHEGHQHHHGHDGSALAELLDLDAEVFHSYLSEVCDWVRRLAGDLVEPRIVDLGCGTGTGTFALLERFTSAEAVAVDASAQMLERVTKKAAALGMNGRVRTVLADLDAAWPDIGTVDVVWAAKSLHHMSDPDRVLTAVFDSLRAKGLLVVTEIDSFPRFLPDDIGVGSPGLEERCHSLMAQRIETELPHMGSDWGPRLSRAGFELVGEHTFNVDLAPPLVDSGRLYARASLRRLRGGVAGKLGGEDLANLDLLIESTGPDGVGQRTDVGARTKRTVWIATRP